MGSPTGTVHRRASLRDCQHTGKRRFRDHQEAVVALHKAVAARARADAHDVVTARRERRAYFCASCNGWHLTSQPLRLDVRLGLAPDVALEVNLRTG